MDNLYRDIILELYRNPLNKKVLADFDVEHRELNASCGDDVTIRIKFDEQGRVADIGHEGIGCAISEAATSLVTDAVKGKTKKEIGEMSEKDVNELLGFEVVYTRKKCAALGLVALQKALNVIPDVARE